MVRHITANGISLAVEQHGPTDGPPLVLIRGQGSQRAHWPAELIEGFANAGFRTITFDNRDTGESQRCPRDGSPGDPDEILRRVKSGIAIPPAYSISDMASDVTGLLDALDIDRAHIFGISMGGGIAQALLTEHADRVISATLVMTACRPLGNPAGTDPAAAAQLIGQLLVYPQSLEQYQAAQVREHELWGSPGFPMPEQDIRDMAALAYARGIDPEGRNRQLLAIGSAPDRRPALRSVDRPCLVLHGIDDALIPVSMGEEIAAHVPGSDFHAINGMGHIITPALAPVIVELVTEFIGRRCA